MPQQDRHSLNPYEASLCGNWFGYVPGNQATLLHNGEAYFTAIETAIDRARHDIYLETYIYENDTNGQRIGDVLLAGGLSPYGIMGLGGNVWEWEETAASRDKGSGSSARGLRGGGWGSGSGNLSSSVRSDLNPAIGNNNIGFRVASPFMEQCQRSSLFGPESMRSHVVASSTVPSQGLPDSPAHRASCRWANNAKCGCGE